MDTLGWVGSLLLAFCGLPQAIKSIKEKHSDGISPVFLFMWGAGEVLTFGYVYDKLDLPLMANYAANIVFVGVIAWYKVRVAV